MKKRILACIFAAATLASLASCGNGGGSSSSTSTASGESGGESTAAEVTTVDYHYVNFGTIAETEPVDDVINEHLESIGSDVRISLHMYDAASYNTQMDLMISSGDPVDLYIPLTGVSTNAAQGKLYDITDIAEANCPNALEMTSDWLDTCTVDGRLYAIPVYKGAMLQNYLIVNKDMADEYGIDPSEYEGQPLSAIEPMLQQIHEANPDIFPVVPLNANAYNFLDFFIGATNGYKIDMLGDRTSTCTGCIVGDDMTVVNLYSTDAFRECCELAYDWMQKGYLMPDTSTSPDSASTLMAASRGFCTTGGYGNSPEMMETNSSLSGNANSSYYVCLEQPYMTTSTIGVTTCVGITSEHPEAALRLLDLFYTDEFVINSILYGVEGRDYVKVTDQTIAFPEGVDSTNVSYDSNTTCGIIGSQFIQWGRNVDEELLLADREFMQTNIDNAVKSPAFGFSFDATSVRTQVSSVNNVITQYFNALTNGELDPGTMIDEFNTALEAAGLNDIIAEKQAQLDAWVAAQQS